MKKNSIWDGNSFSGKHSWIPNFSGETLRVGAGPTMPTGHLTTVNGTTVNINGGFYHRYLEIIAEKEALDINWIDVLTRENTVWGTLYDNGTATGSIKLILEYQVDVNNPAYCGVPMHRHIACSVTPKFAGFSPIMPKQQPIPSWMGLLQAFDMPSWCLILCTVIGGTFMLGLFSRGKDWMLHFMDAFHPMCGRNMAFPGFNATHLGRG